MCVCVCVCVCVYLFVSKEFDMKFILLHKCVCFDMTMLASYF